MFVHCFWLEVFVDDWLASALVSIEGSLVAAVVALKAIHAAKSCSTKSKSKS
jgi:hypothetical protein